MLKNFCVSLAMALALPVGAASEALRMEGYTPSPLYVGLDLQYSRPRYLAWEFVPGTLPSDSSQGLRLGVDWITPFPYGTLTLGFGLSGSVLPNVLVGKKGDGSAIYASLNAFPLDVSLSYRLLFVYNQILVPFGRIGTSAVLAAQTSKTGGEKTGTFAGIGWDWGVGLEISLHSLDRISQNLFDTDFGVNHTFLVVEYIQSRSVLRSSQPNFSRDEIRAGLRFEL